MISFINKRKKIFIVTIVAIIISHSAIAKSSPPSVIAAGNLLKRILPAYSNKFLFEEIKSEKDVFELESEGNKIIIRGNNANSMAVGIGYYLKHYCKTTISWYRSDSIFMPGQLPVVNKKITQTARCHNRFFLNYCTFGYSIPWWNWNDWQWFIDWMALNGINMPLAITGQEAVWYKVWKKLGLSDEQIRTYFTGPAFLPWHRMANIDHWDGPLPSSWLKNQLILQKNIVTRERELGMRPVLPAFSGHVPELLKLKYPGAKITSLGKWGGFDNKYQSYFLDPMDPLFRVIQKAFLHEQQQLYGSDHIYGIDPFNEVTPPSWEPEYLAAVSKTMYNSISTVDPEAKWLQMSWIFYFQKNHWTNSRIKAYLNAVPQDKMILLDYYCDKAEEWKSTDKFFGQPYLWCYLGNFGGNTMLAGNLKEVGNNLENAFLNGGNNMWGIGSTLEGFDMNPVMYNFLFEKAWSNDTVDTETWIKQWADSRVGRSSKNVEDAWKILLDEVYNDPAKLGQGTQINALPSLKGGGNWTSSEYHYKNSSLLKAWVLLIKEDNTTSRIYQFDVVNIGRQVLGNYFSVLRDSLVTSYKRKDLADVRQNGQKMLDLMDDLDDLLQSHESFLLGKWLEDAKRLGTTNAEKEYYEKDARTIITTWGVPGQLLNDYANRSWAGLTKDFYKMRWKIFIDALIESIQSRQPFNQAKYQKNIIAFESGWINDHKSFTNKAIGNSGVIAKALYVKYCNEIVAANR